MNYYSSGSGIYSNGNVLEYYFNPTWSSSSSLMVATLPKSPQSPSSPPPRTFKEEQITKMEEEYGNEILKCGMDKVTTNTATNITTFVASPGTKGVVEATYGNLTCLASYQVSYPVLSSF